jgi:hypothetical protein
MAEVNFARFARVLEDQAYVAVGFGVLGYHKAQACRRAWQRELSGAARAERAPSPPKRPPSAAERFRPFVYGAAGMAAERLRPLVSDAADRVAPLVSDAAERVGPIVSEAAERVGPLVSEAAERMGPLVSEAAEQLRPEAQEFLRAAGDLMNDLPADARELTKDAVAFGRSFLQAFRSPHDKDN